MKSEYLDRVRETYTGAAGKMGDIWFSDERWPFMVDLADKLEEWLEAKPPQRILDLACGTASPTVALALKGYAMTGLDLTPAMLDVARRGAEKKGAQVEWLCQDMRTIDYREAFDHVMVRDVIFGIFEDEKEDADLIRRMAAAVKPSGRCLFEAYNKEFAMSRGVQGSHFYDAVSDRFVAKDPTNPLRTLKLYSLEEWERMLRANALLIVKTDGWKWKHDPDPPPWRADIIVARKEP